MLGIPFRREYPAKRNDKRLQHIRQNNKGESLRARLCRFGDTPINFALCKVEASLPHPAAPFAIRALPTQHETHKHPLSAVALRFMTYGSK
jgi:hypothetical protein